MGGGRSAIAAKISPEKLREAVLEAFGGEQVGTETFDEFYDVKSYCRDHSEMLGGEVGQEAWYIWKSGEYAVMGDLSMELPHSADALARLSKAVGGVVACAIDPYQEYAFFAYFEDGALKRRLVLEDEEILEEGLPVKAERGRHIDDFNEEEAGRLWLSYKLPTFDHDPLEGPFHCFAAKLG